MSYRRTRKSWMRAQRGVAMSKNFTEWLNALHDRLAIPKYAVQQPIEYDRKTGKPVKYKWVVDRSSVENRCYITKIAVKQEAKGAQKGLMDLFMFFESGNLPIIYSTMDSQDNQVMRRVIVTYDTIQTGGGHNDTPTFARALCFQLAHSEYQILSGQEKL